MIFQAWSFLSSCGVFPLLSSLTVGSQTHSIFYCEMELFYAEMRSNFAGVVVSDSSIAYDYIVLNQQLCVKKMLLMGLPSAIEKVEHLGWNVAVLQINGGLCYGLGLQMCLPIMTGETLIFWLCLGLQINPDRPDDRLPFRGAWFWLGAEMIHVMELPNLDPQTGRPAHVGRDRHTCVGIKNLDALRIALENAGEGYLGVLNFFWSDRENLLASFLL